MKDGPLRKFVKKMALICYTVDLKVTRWMAEKKGHRRYKLGGSCEMCAKCCESPMIQTNFFFFHIGTLRWLFLKWHKVVNGFEYKGEIVESKTFIFNCTHFDEETRKCDSYDSRPGMCRDYPRGLLDSSNPKFFPQCGFYAVDKRAEKFSRSLEERLDLPPEKLEELKEKLHLKE